MGRLSTAESLKEYFSSGVAKKKWADAQAKAKEATGYGEYDDGKYTAQLSDIKVTRSEGTGRLQAVLSFKFTEGEYAGKTVRQYQGIEEQGIEYLLKTLKVLGYSDITPEELEDEIFPKLKKLKPVVKLRLKTKDGSEYQNVYVLGPVDEEVTDETEDEEREDVDDSVETKPKKDSKAAEDSDEDDDEGGEEASEDEDSEDDEDAEEEEEEEKPKLKKPSKKVAPKKAAEEDEETDDDADEDEPSEDKAKIDVGTKVIVRVDGKEIKSQIVKILEERKDGTGTIKVESLKTGKKYVVDVPADVVDIIE